MLKAVKHYKVPGYPEKMQVYKKPELITRIPERWKGNRYVSAALTSLFLMSMTACVQNDPLNGNDSENSKKNTAMVSPIFEHGDGRGSFGCMSVAPPAFLSEEEAMQVIIEEGIKVGLKFDNVDYTLKNVKIPVTSLNYNYSEKDDEKDKLLKTVKGDLKLDGFDEDKKIGVEFVSKDDVVSWHEGNVNSSVESYNMIKAAKTLRQGIGNLSEEASVGVFYDSVSWLGENGLKEEADSILRDGKIEWSKKEVMLKELSEKQLREQVVDFIEWLKGQGII